MNIERKAVVTALEKVRPGLATRELIEQSTSFAFVAGRVVTYNDEISISHPLDCMVDLTGAVNARPLYDFLVKTDKEEVGVEWNDTQMVITAGRAKVGLPFVREIRLPIDEINKGGTWSQMPEGMLEALKLCAMCCAQDMSRPVLTCVHAKGRIIEASDSYQIVRFSLPQEVVGDSFLIPSSSVNELSKFDVKEISKDDSWVHFRTEDGTVFSARIVSGDYPDTTPHLAVKGTTFEFPDTTAEALERGRIFSSGELTIGSMPLVTVDIKDKTLNLTAKNEFGWFEESLPMDAYTGAPLKFTIVLESLASLLKRRRTCIMSSDKVRFDSEGWEHVIAISEETKA